MVDRVQTGVFSRHPAIRTRRERLDGDWQPWVRVQLVVASAQLMADATAFVLASAVAAVVSDGARMFVDPDDAEPIFRHFGGHFMSAVAIFALALFAGLAARGHRQRRVSLLSGLPDLLVCAGLGLLVSAVFQLASDGPEPWLLVVTAWTLFPLAAVALRWVARALLTRTGFWQIPTLIVGDGDTAEEAARALGAHPALGYRVVGRVSRSAVSEQAGPLMWRRLMLRYRAHLVVVAGDGGMRPSADAMGALERENVPFAIVRPAEEQLDSGALSAGFFNHDSMALSYRSSLLRPLWRGAKTVVDVLAAIVLLLVLVPIFLVVAALVKADGGPVFYAHTRIGAGGRRFGCMKFRSMAQDSDAILSRILRDDPERAAEWNATQKLRCDPRITRIGAVLRKTSLDEMPQLLNVVRLEMSLVGPRPIVEKEMEHYGSEIEYYLRVRPGITGLWQVSGRSDTTYDERVRLDSSYVKNWTLWNDFVILLKTVPAVLNGRGAV